jgi:hypothetical protein
MRNGEHVRVRTLYRNLANVYEREGGGVDGEIYESP